MSGRAFLLENEQLLLEQRSSPAALILYKARSLLDGIIVGAAIDVLLLMSAFGFGWNLPLWLCIVIPVIAYVIIAIKRFLNWKHATFQVTNERLLLHTPGTFFHVPLRTIKWSQYQESYVGHRSFLDFFFRSRPLHIRFGTADAPREFHFPSLRYTEDIKHYLDKIDAAIRHNDTSSIRPFIAKPRGKRD